MAANRKLKPDQPSVADHGGRRRKTHLRLDQPSDSGDATKGRTAGLSVSEEEEAVLWGRVDLEAFVSRPETRED